MTNNGKIALLDGYAHIYRGFYAIRNLTNPRGEPINALYAIARLLLKLDHDLPHEYGAMVMDKGKPAKRLQLLPEYKATRPPMPPALRQQLPLIRDWVEAAGWSIIEEEGREAGGRRRRDGGRRCDDLGGPQRALLPLIRQAAPCCTNH